MVIEILHNLVLGTLQDVRGVLDQLRIIGGMDGWWGGVLFGLVLLHVVARIAVARTERRPSYLLDLKELQHEWASSTWYWKVFMPFLSLFVLGYLAIAWAVHGAQVLLELLVRALHMVLRAILWLWKWLVWLLGKLWWGLQWVWREVIDVTIVFLLKLVWHYVFVWTYRFFYWCLNKLFTAYNRELIRTAVFLLFLANLTLLVGVWSSSLVGSYWPLACGAIPAYLLLLGGSGTILHRAEGKSGQPAWRGALYRQPLTWAIAVLLAGGLFLLMGSVTPATRLVVWGVSLNLALVAVPLGALLIFALLTAWWMLPNHAQANDGVVQVGAFVRAAAWRTPKFLLASPYRLLGIGIISALPALLGALIYFGANKLAQQVGASHPSDTEHLTTREEEWKALRDSCATVDEARSASELCHALASARIEIQMSGLSQGSSAWAEAIINAASGISDPKIPLEALKNRRDRYVADSIAAWTAVDSATSHLERAKVKLSKIEALYDARLQPADTAVNNPATTEQDQPTTEPNDVLMAQQPAQIVTAEMVEEAKRGVLLAEETEEQATLLAERHPVIWTLDEMELNGMATAMRWHNARWIVTGLLAIVAMALLFTLILVPAWIYDVLKNAELYAYCEEGGTYAADLFNVHRARDVRQPVMGWIILLMTIPLLGTLTITGFASGLFSKAISLAPGDQLNVLQMPDGSLFDVTGGPNQGSTSPDSLGAAAILDSLAAASAWEAAAAEAEAAAAAAAAAAEEQASMEADLWGTNEGVETDMGGSYDDGTGWIDDVVPEEQIFTIAEEMPSFPGGEAELFKYLGKNIMYPEIANSAGISGVVYMTFVVNKDGTLRDVKVLRGIGGGCDEEAMRVVKNMPAWKPGKQRGKSVTVQYNLPIRFTLR